jgi:hypothetical protein
MTIKMSLNWNDNFLQFTRLIAEANAMGAFTPKRMKDMAESMDLDVIQVQWLIDRAEIEFDNWKQTGKINRNARATQKKIDKVLS